MIAKLQSTIGKIDFWIQLAQPGVILILRCLTGFILPVPVGTKSPT